MTFVYPSTEFDDIPRMTQTLGSLWTAAFDTPGQIESLQRSRNVLQLVQRDLMTEAQATVGRHTIPILSRPRWRPIYLLESELNATDASVARYGDGEIYGTDLKYGTPRQGNYYVFPAPNDLREIPLITDKISEPGVQYTSGLDFQLQVGRGALVFRKNPFEDENLQPEELFSGGVVVDRQLTLWLYRAGVEAENVHKYAGYLVGLNLPSSQNYLDLVNAVQDAAIGGPSQQAFREAVAAVTDVPVIKEDGEVVELVTRDRNHKLIVTDKHVYRYHLDATANVVAGDTLKAGDIPVNSVRIYDLRQGSLPSDISAIEFPADLLLPDFSGGVVFNNETVALEVDTSGTLTQVEFSLGGWPGDVERFWELMHERGENNPPTLAQLLDNRTNPAGEPVASNLPSTLNPAEFLVENVLRNYAVLVKIKVEERGSNALSLKHLRYLRRILPPQTAVLILVELAVSEESITMSGPGDETTPGATEDYETFLGSDPLEDSVDPATYVTESGTLGLVHGQCV